MNDMKELILKLYEENYCFEYCPKNTLNFDTVDTGYYGKVTTRIIYNYYKDNGFTIFYGHKGYPLSETFYNVEDIFKFLKTLC